jgi:hypothetical protein
MGHSQVYRGQVKKDRCVKCNSPCYFFMENQVMRNQCTICKLPKEKEK